MSEELIVPRRVGKLRASLCQLPRARQVCLGKYLSAGDGEEEKPGKWGSNR